MTDGCPPLKLAAHVNAAEQNQIMSVSPLASALVGPLFAKPQVLAIFSDERRLQAMLDAEAALARAQARLGIIPADAADTIAAHCTYRHFDLAALGAATAAAGNPAIPLVKELTALCGEAGRYVHWGATSQDIIDTGLVLQLRDLFALLQDEQAKLIAALTDLAERHRDTVMPGRTFMQHALPTTFGYRAATWLDALLRQARRNDCLAQRVCCAQFGGAVGTLASLGTDAPQVQQEFARELSLRVPDLPWHATRDRVAETGTVLGLLAGTLAKMARDISLLMQSEIGELAEPSGPGRGGSSTMPQKRNPVGCAAILAQCEQVHALVPVVLSAMAADHERGTGSWHAEWLALPQIATLSASALITMRELIEGLHVDAERMQANLDMHGGVIMAEAIMMALAPHIGRLNAHHKVADACRRAIDTATPLLEVLTHDREIIDKIPAAQLAIICQPGSYVGAAPMLTDKMVMQARQFLGERNATD